MSLFSIVAPLYNEEGNVAELLRRIAGIMDSLTASGDDDYEIVVVNDGSSDGTLRELKAQCATRPQLVVVDLSRNFGHQIAATAGLDAAAGDAVILMDGDLQDPPELIARFIEKWRDGYDRRVRDAPRAQGRERFQTRVAYTTS